MGLENSFESRATFAPPFEIERLQQWLNKEHTGKPFVPFNVRVSEELKDAHHKLHMHREMHVQFEIDKDGEWTVDTIRFRGKTYKLVEVK